MEVSGSVLGFGARYPWLLNDGDLRSAAPARLARASGGRRINLLINPAQDTSAREQDGMRAAERLGPNGLRPNSSI